MGVTYDNNGRLHRVSKSCDEVQDVDGYRRPGRSFGNRERQLMIWIERRRPYRLTRKNYRQEPKQSTVRQDDCYLVRLGLHSVPHVARMEKVEWLVVDVPQLLRATLLFIIDDDFPNEREEISKKSRQILSAADMQALSNEIPCREPTVLNAPLH